MTTTLPLRVGHAVFHRRRRRDEREVELALESLAHDLHVQQAEETAAKTEAQRGRRLGLEAEARIVQRQLVERLAQIGELVAVDRDRDPRTPSAWVRDSRAAARTRRRVAAVMVSPERA